MRWCVNFDAIINSLDELVGFESSKEKYRGPTFFLNGALSVNYEDEVYRNEFPSAKIHRIEGAGHYIYNDKGQTTAKILSECLSEIEESRWSET